MRQSILTIPRLSTERLSLRRPEPRDRKALISLADDWEVAKNLARLPNPYGEKDADFYFKEVVPNELTWAIVLADEFIGSIGLTPHDEEKWELGYWIGQQYWGYGYVTEAAKSVLSWAITTLERPTIVSGCFTENAASYRVLRKLGFVEVGLSSRASLARGQELSHKDMVLHLDS